MEEPSCCVHMSGSSDLQNSKHNRRVGFSCMNDAEAACRIWCASHHFSPSKQIFIDLLNSAYLFVWDWVAGVR